MNSCLVVAGRIPGCHQAHIRPLTMQVILLIGIPAVGKSTFFRERFADTHVRINRDMLKTRNREQRLFKTCLEVCQSLVVDNTNATREVRAKFIIPAVEAGAIVSGYYFHSAASEALVRNASRSGAARIPDKGVLSMSAQLQLPSLAEGFDTLKYVRIEDNGGFSVKRWNPTTTNSPSS